MARKKKTGPKPGTVHNIPRTARILAAAHLTSVKATAEATGLSQAQILEWRKALKINEKLQDAYAEEVKRQDGKWRERLAQSSTRAIEALIEMLDDCRVARQASEDIEQTMQIMTLERGIANDLLEHATGGESLMGPASE